MLVNFNQKKQILFIKPEILNMWNIPYNTIYSMFHI